MSVEVSIPFIAGQWSLLYCILSVVEVSVMVSIPFIAGQWSLLARVLELCLMHLGSFNPLHCGAVVASGKYGIQGG